MEKLYGVNIYDYGDYAGTTYVTDYRAQAEVVKAAHNAAFLHSFPPGNPNHLRYEAVIQPQGISHALPFIKVVFYGIIREEEYVSQDKAEPRKAMTAREAVRVARSRRANHIRIEHCMITLVNNEIFMPSVGRSGGYLLAEYSDTFNKLAHEIVFTDNRVASAITGGSAYEHERVFLAVSEEEKALAETLESFAGFSQQ